MDEIVNEIQECLAEIKGLEISLNNEQNRRERMLSALSLLLTTRRLCDRIYPEGAINPQNSDLEDFLAKHGLIVE